MDYKFSEDKIIQEIKEYIDKTYTQHYGNSKYQATDMIVDSGHGRGFCIGNIMKYAKRFGKKDGENEADIMKIIHYAIILLHSIREERDKYDRVIISNDTVTYLTEDEDGATN